VVSTTGRKNSYAMAKTPKSLTRQERSVARLLRHRRTQLYFQDDGWTDSPQEAKAFFDVVEAAETCTQHGLNEVDLIVRVRAESCDLFCTSLR